MSFPKGVLVTLVCSAAAVAQDGTSSPEWKTPAVDAGEVVILPDASFQPRSGSKAVFDVTEQNSPAEVAKGLIRVARWLNLNAGAGIDPKDISVTVVLHGDATKAALSHNAYKKHAGQKENPNLKLLRELKQYGVELSVCGQALAHHGYALSDVATEVKPAAAALTVLVQRQQAGFAVLSY